MRFTNNWFRHDLSSPYEHPPLPPLPLHLVHDGNPLSIYHTASASPCCSGIKSTLVEEGPCLFSSTTVGTLDLLILKTLHSPFALHQRMVYFGPWAFSPRKAYQLARPRAQAAAAALFFFSFPPFSSLTRPQRYLLFMNY